MPPVTDHGEVKGFWNSFSVQHRRVQEGGWSRQVTVEDFAIAKDIAGVNMRLTAGGIRELHWHPNADEWQYYVQGQGRMTVFFNGGKARTADFVQGDVGFVPRTFGHYVENTGADDLIFLEMFKANRFRDFSLSEWVRNTPPELVMQHLGLKKETLQAIPARKAEIVPA